MFLWISVDNSCRRLRTGTPRRRFVYRSGTISSGAERLVMSNSSISRFRPHCGLQWPWSSPLVRGRANYVPPEVSERLPHRGFDRPRTSFHLAHQHRALNSGDTEVGQPIHVGVCRQSTLCLFPDEARSLFFTISKRWLRSCRMSSSLSVTPLPTVPNEQPLVMRNFLCSSMCEANHRSRVRTQLIQIQ